MSGRMFLDNGLSLAHSPDGVWQVFNCSTPTNLIETADFFRVWILLELPFADVKSELDALAISGIQPFPFGKLIASTLKACSNQWAERALPWVPFLAPEDKAELGNLLEEVRQSKWASQKVRQLASKYQRI
jgi:hypothetical protein